MKSAGRLVIRDGNADFAEGAYNVNPWARIARTWTSQAIGFRVLVEDNL